MYFLYTHLPPQTQVDHFRPHPLSIPNLVIRRIHIPSPDPISAIHPLDQESQTCSISPPWYEYWVGGGAQYRALVQLPRFHFNPPPLDFYTIPSSTYSQKWTCQRPQQAKRRGWTLSQDQKKVREGRVKMLGAILCGVLEFNIYSWRSHDLRRCQIHVRSKHVKSAKPHPLIRHPLFFSLPVPSCGTGRERSWRSTCIWKPPLWASSSCLCPDGRVYLRYGDSQHS